MRRGASSLILSIGFFGCKQSNEALMNEMIVHDLNGRVYDDETKKKFSPLTGIPNADCVSSAEKLIEKFFSSTENDKSMETEVGKTRWQQNIKEKPEERKISYEKDAKRLCSIAASLNDDEPISGTQTNGGRKNKSKNGGGGGSKSSISKKSTEA